ncbi:MAG TPA: response regulator [Burkholderiales bacterium]|nr:response regulator [Burkholderiales bacterium]
MPSQRLRVVNSGEDRPKRHRLRVLVADDDRDTAVMLAAILRDEGDEVHTVLRGDEVLDVVRLFRPDAVILDLNLPGMSGYALAHEIRERHGAVAPMLIAISGVWKDTGERLAGQAMGFDHYLVKPCDPKQVLAILERRRAGEADDKVVGE